MQMDITKPRVISLFSGAGGLDIGFEQAGFRTVFATDVWDIACETLKKNDMADEVFCGDVRNINFKELKEKYGEIDCLIGTSLPTLQSNSPLPCGQGRWF